MSKVNKKTPDDVIDVVDVTPFSNVSIVDFNQINVSWV